MEEEKNKILNQLSTDLSKINNDSFYREMKNCTKPTECVDVSLKFCELINTVKTEAYKNLNESLESFIKNKVGLDRSFQSLKNDISTLNSNIKTIKKIIYQRKFLKKYRKLRKKKIVYDSLEDNESLDEKENKDLIFTEGSNILFVFDFIMLISSIFLFFHL